MPFGITQETLLHQGHTSPYGAGQGGNIVADLSVAVAVVVLSIVVVAAVAIRFPAWRSATILSYCDALRQKYALVELKSDGANPCL